MKLFKMFIAASALALPCSVLAASPTSILSAHVPFAFVMAGQQFEAGDYQIQQSGNGIIRVQGRGKAAMAISVPSSAPKAGAPSALQFTKEEAQERLISVRMEGAELRILGHAQPERSTTLTSSR